MGERGSYAQKQTSIISIQTIILEISFYIRELAKICNFAVNIALNKFQKNTNCLKWEGNSRGLSFRENSQIKGGVQRKCHITPPTFLFPNKLYAFNFIIALIERNQILSSFLIRHNR